MTADDRGGIPVDTDPGDVREPKPPTSLADLSPDERANVHRAVFGEDPEFPVAADPDLRTWFARTRREVGASLRDVAEETGIGNATLSEFENGKHDLPWSKVLLLMRWWGRLAREARAADTSPARVDDTTLDWDTAATAAVTERDFPVEVCVSITDAHPRDPQGGGHHEYRAELTRETAEDEPCFGEEIGRAVVAVVRGAAVLDERADAILRSVADTVGLTVSR